MTPREAVRELLAAYKRNDILTAASAIAFRLAFALIPATLAVLGLLGGFGLTDVWTQHAVPQLRDSLSPPAFQLLDQTARQVLSQRQLFWMTIGTLIAIWEVSSATRGVMGVFDRIYETDRERTAKQRYVVSIALAVAVSALILAAIAVVQLGPLVLGGPLALLRWPLAVVLLLAAIAVQVRYAPAEAAPAGWVTFGSVLVVMSWIVTSIAFMTYATQIASYHSVFGALAVVIVAFEYLYLAAISFLTGAQLDALIRERLEGDATGQPDRRRSRRTRVTAVATDS